MKKVWMLPLVAVFAVSCGGSEDVESDENSSSEEVIAEDSLEMELEEAVVYETVEDYGQILTKTELYEIFGEENIKDDVAWYAEGTVKLECSYLTNPDNGNYIKYVWSDEDPDKLGSIEVSFNIYDEDFAILGTQEIGTECGVYTGMSLVDLREWNGAAFEFSGFGWDYAGGIMAEAGSKISDCPVGMRLDYDYEDTDEEKAMQVLGDQTLSSDGDEAKGAAIFLGTLSYYPN